MEKEFQFLDGALVIVVEGNEFLGGASFGQIFLLPISKRIHCVKTGHP
jgi:hypothetical protein